VSAGTRSGQSVVAVAVALLISSACSAGAPSTAAPVATPHATLSGIEDLKPGTYAFDFPLLHTPGKPFHDILVTLPAGWSSFEGFAVRRLVDTPRQMAVSTWFVIDVYVNGCQWLGPKLNAGQTVDELAAVLAARPLRNATAPVAVTLGGFHGKYLEWSVPRDIQFGNCDQGMFKSWVGDGDRYQQGPGQVDQLWMLDVDGRRIVIDATYMPGATEQDRADLAKVVASIAFEP
jgi:hypothetical protein